MLCRPPIGMGQDAMDCLTTGMPKAMVIHVVHWLGGWKGPRCVGCTAWPPESISSRIGLHSLQIVRWNRNNVMKLPTKFQLPADKVCAWGRGRFENKSLIGSEIIYSAPWNCPYK
jgi:hypothetical protein